MSVVWHDVECGGYAADLSLWEELAGEAGGPVLELGCGTGRVALHLARRGFTVAGLDIEAELVAAFNERASELPADAQAGDARDFDLGREFGLVAAPMQLVQLLGDEAERIACLSCAAAHLRPGGRVAVAIVERMPEPLDGPPPPPDAREADGWLYSSLPLEAALGGGEIRIRRLRQTVSPGGTLRDELDEVRLRTLSASDVEHEAAIVGLSPAGRRAVPATEAHVGSTVVLLRRDA